MMYLCIIFIPPLYFLIRGKVGAFILNLILYGLAWLCVLTFIGIIVAPLFWVLSVGHAMWHLRKELVAEHADMIATRMAEQLAKSQNPQPPRVTAPPRKVNTGTTLLAVLTLCFCVGSSALTGCVSMGKDFNEANVQKIQKGVTTQADLVGWFGQPSNRVATSQGMVTLMWSHYTSRGFVGHTTGKTLSVTLGADGTVSDFSSSGGEM